MSLEVETHGCVRDVVAPYAREVYDLLMSGLIQYYIAFPELVYPKRDRPCPMTKDMFDVYVRFAEHVP